MLLQLFNPEEIQFCLDNSCEMQDGSKTKALTGLKKNEESVTIPDKVRNFVTSKIYNNSFVDSVINPTRVSVNF